MNYPIVIHKDTDSTYGVIVPDLPGCHSAGDTLDEALVMAKEAILGHLEVLVELGRDIPDPKPLEVHRKNPDYADAALWAVVDVDTDNLPGKSVRLNISMNERVLAVADEFAARTGETRSGLLQKAVSQYIRSTGAAQRKPAPRPKKSAVKQRPKQKA